MLDLLFQSAPIGFAVVDRQHRYVRINDHLASINGMPPEAHIGRRIEEVVPALAPIAGPLIERVFTSGLPLPSVEFEAPAPHDPQARSWWLLSLFPVRGHDGEVEYVGGTAIEVTDRKLAQMAVAESRERLQLAAAAAGVGVWEWRLDTNEMIYSQEAKAICGFPLDQPVTYEMVAAVTHPDDFPHTSAQARRALDPDIRDQSPYEYRLRLATGEERWVLARGHAVFEEREGRPVASRYVGAIQDITERKRAELQAEMAAARLRLALEAGRMAVWYADETSVEATPELNRMLGLPEDVRPGLEEYAKGYLPGERERVRAVAAEAMARGDRYFEVEYQYRRGTGETVWLAMRAEILPSQRAAIGVLMDVTARKEAEERMKLLAREVDHRANNLLTVVQGIVSLSRGADAEELRQVIAGRVGALARAHQLLAESRWEGAELRRLVEEELLAFSLGDAERVRLEGPEVAVSPAASQAVAMVLHELATNAVKHGALSTPKGAVEVRWAVRDGVLELVWRETGGPKVRPPVRRGMGTRVLGRALGGGVGGETRLEWPESGLVCTLRLPAPASAEATRPELPA